MDNLLKSISAYHLKAAYHKALHDVAGHIPSLQRVDKGYNILTRDSMYAIVRAADTALLTFTISKYERGIALAQYQVVPSQQSCSCFDSAESHNLCKHRLAVKMLLDAFRLQKFEQAKGSTGSGK